MKHWLTDPRQPEIITRDGELKRLPSTSPSEPCSSTREIVAKSSPLKGIAYALAAIADNIAALTDMVALRGEELHTELAQLNEYVRPDESKENHE